MGNLIEPADLQDYGLTTEQASSPLALRLIASASAQVIDAAGTPIGGERSTVTLVQPPGSKILALPGLPVQEVHEVTVAGDLVEDWLQVAGGLWRSAGWGSGDPVPVTVDYTHGPPTVPDDIHDLVCRMVLAGILNAEDGAEGLVLNNGALSSIGIDDFRESYATGDQVEAVTEMTLPERVRIKLAKRFGNRGPSVRGTW